MPSVSALNAFPIKSCQGISVNTLQFDKYGPVGDRRWMIVDSDGTFITQRKNPALALISVKQIKLNTIELSAPNALPITVALNQQNHQLIDTSVWGTACRGIDCGDAISKWLESYLSTPARLIGMDSNFVRTIKKSPQNSVSYADGYPLLIASEESLNSLNAELEDAVPMNRFRPNIVLQGCEPFEEDSWSKIQIGDVILQAAGPCQRCIVTTIEQRTATRTGKEPLATLTRMRKAISSKPIFGQNYINLSKSGSIEVGMSVQILG